MMRARHGPDAVADGHEQTACSDGMRPVPAVSPDMADPKVLSLARRLYWRRYSQRIQAMGIESEDALQIVFLGLLTRSRSASRWDPSRGGLSTWVFVAMGGILLNLVDHQRRMLRRSGSVGMGEDVALTVRAVEEEGVEEDAEQATPVRDGRWRVGVDAVRTADGRSTAGQGGVHGVGTERAMMRRVQGAQDRDGRVGATHGIGTAPDAACGASGGRERGR